MQRRMQTCKLQTRNTHHATHGTQHKLHRPQCCGASVPLYLVRSSFAWFSSSNTPALFSCHICLKHTASSSLTRAFAVSTCAHAQQSRMELTITQHFTEANPSRQHWPHTVAGSCGMLQHSTLRPFWYLLSTALWRAVARSRRRCAMARCEPHVRFRIAHGTISSNLVRM